MTGGGHEIGGSGRRIGHDLLKDWTHVWPMVRVPKDRAHLHRSGWPEGRGAGNQGGLKEGCLKYECVRYMYRTKGMDGKRGQLY